jgi:hypothetical protein
MVRSLGPKSSKCVLDSALYCRANIPRLRNDEDEDARTLEKPFCILDKALPPRSGAATGAISQIASLKPTGMISPHRASDDLPEGALGSAVTFASDESLCGRDRAGGRLGGKDVNRCLHRRRFTCPGEQNSILERRPTQLDVAVAFSV